MEPKHSNMAIYGYCLCAEGEKRGTVLLLLYVERIMKHPDSEFCDHCRSAESDYCRCAEENVKHPGKRPQDLDLVVMLIWCTFLVHQIRQGAANHSSRPLIAGIDDFNIDWSTHLDFDVQTRRCNLMGLEYWFLFGVKREVDDSDVPMDMEEGGNQQEQQQHDEAEHHQEEELEQAEQVQHQEGQANGNGGEGGDGGDDNGGQEGEGEGDVIGGLVGIDLLIEILEQQVAVIPPPTPDVYEFRQQEHQVGMEEEEPVVEEQNQGLGGIMFIDEQQQPDQGVLDDIMLIDEEQQPDQEMEGILGDFLFFLDHVAEIGAGRPPTPDTQEPPKRRRLD